MEKNEKEVLFMVLLFIILLPIMVIFDLARRS